MNYITMLHVSHLLSDREQQTPTLHSLYILKIIKLSLVEIGLELSK